MPFKFSPALQGRVLYDVIIYNVSSPLSEVQKYLVECDAAVASDIVSHLKKYKLRKSCDIVNVSDVFEVKNASLNTIRLSALLNGNHNANGLIVWHIVYLCNCGKSSCLILLNGLTRFLQCGRRRSVWLISPPCRDNRNSRRLLIQF